MGSQCKPCDLLRPLLISALLCLFLTQGSARNIKTMRSSGWGLYNDASPEGVVAGERREMAEMDLIAAVDYAEPGANTNPRAGTLWGAPPPPGPKH